jgi:hypothetical protein
MAGFSVRDFAEKCWRAVILDTVITARYYWPILRIVPHYPICLNARGQFRPIQANSGRLMYMVVSLGDW